MRKLNSIFSHTTWTTPYQGMTCKINIFFLACRIKLVQKRRQTFYVKNNWHTKIIIISTNMFVWNFRYQHTLSGLEKALGPGGKPLKHCGFGILSQAQFLCYLNSFILGKMELPVPKKKDFLSLIKIIPKFSWTSKGSYETFLLVKFMEYGT